MRRRRNTESELDSVVEILVDQKKTAELSAKANEKPKKTRKELRRQKRADKALRKKAKRLVIPKTVQESIPYTRVYPDSGIIEVRNGFFVRCYALQDVNYAIARQEEQLDMLEKFGEFVNSFDASSRFQFLVNKQLRNIAEFEALTMLKLDGHEYDKFREEHNERLRNEIRKGENDKVKQKVAAVMIPAANYPTALSTFTRLDTEIEKNMKYIGGARATPLSAAEYLELIHDMYNPDQIGMFGNVMEMDPETGKPVFAKEKFSFDFMRRMGLTTKDVVGPESLTFQSDYGKVGHTYFRVLFLKTIPNIVKDYYLDMLTEVNCRMAISLQYQPIDTAVALKMVKNDGRGVHANIIDRQKAATQAGYSPDLIPPELKDAAAENDMIHEELTSKNQKMFYQTVTIIHYAESKEQLDADTKAIQAVGQKELLNFRPLTYQQPNGLASCLPLSFNQLALKRTLLTDGVVMFNPFSNLELMDPVNGIFYGVNAVSRNLILFNRRHSKNGNGMVLGGPGSGKSMISKQEMFAVLISSQDHVMVIDPDGEYLRLAEMMGGEVIHIAPGSGAHLNPFDIDLENCEGNPIVEKSDFICTIFEAITAGQAILTAGQRSIIDRCVKTIYLPYLTSKDPETGAYDPNALPTLKTFYEELRRQDGYEAMQLADALEFYAVGSQDMFAHHTNVEYHNRFVVFDIKDIGSSMKSLGELVVLSTIWNQVVAGRKNGEHVWIYIDEVYLLFKNELSAEFLRNLYKRARKYGAIPTAMTQNVSDILNNPIASTMIMNCEFVVMLSQSSPDLDSIKAVFPYISPTQIESIKNAPPGHGLIYDGQNLVPFINELPHNTLQYRAMTTKLSEVKAMEEENGKE